MTKLDYGAPTPERTDGDRPALLTELRLDASGVVATCRQLPERHLPLQAGNYRLMEGYGADMTPANAAESFRSAIAGLRFLQEHSPNIEGIDRIISMFDERVERAKRISSR